MASGLRRGYCSADSSGPPPQRLDILEFQERNHYAKDRAVEGRREEIPLGTKLRLENKEREYETTME
jgi:hypothetical protein